MNEIIQDIRKRCRMQMDGIASTSMRKKGLIYKLNFGVPIQEIKTIAKRYQPNAELAELLWIDETRELKILATLLYPPTEFNDDIAQRWVEQIPNQEIREQLVFNLLQKLDHAESWAKDWANNTNQKIRSTGYWLLARLIITKNYHSNFTEDAYSYLWDDLLSTDISLRNAAILFLKNAGRLSSKTCDLVLKQLHSFKNSDNQLEKEIYDSLAFEYEYLHD